MTRTRKWVSGTVVLALVVLVAGWFLLVSPKKADAASLQAAALAQQSTNDGLRAKVSQLKAQDAQRPQQEAKLAKFRQQVPETPSEPALIRHLNALAKQTQVEVETVSVINPAGLQVPGAPAAEDHTQLEQITLSFVIQGSYFNAERFLNLIEGSGRVMLVTGLSIDKTAILGKDAAVNTSIHKYTITARIFVATNPPAGSKPVTAPSTAPANASPTTVQ